MQDAAFYETKIAEARALRDEAIGRMMGALGRSLSSRLRALGSLLPHAAKKLPDLRAHRAGLDPYRNISRSSLSTILP